MQFAETDVVVRAMDANVTEVLLLVQGGTSAGSAARLAEIWMGSAVIGILSAWHSPYPMSSESSRSESSGPMECED